MGTARMALNVTAAPQVAERMTDCNHGRSLVDPVPGGLPQPSKHYGNGYETTLAAKAIAAIKEAGRVAVSYHSTHGCGPGFYAHWVGGDGSLGRSIGTVSPTEAEAWLSVAIRLAEYKPGVLQMTSREFGTIWTANVLCQDGSLGSLQRRSRFEIRKLSGQYEVFLLDRNYLRGKEARDVRQDPQGDSFATLTEAAGYVGQYIADYEDAAADDREAAIEAQREREREDS